MTERLIKRLAWLRAFMAGNNTAEIARQYGYPEAGAQIAVCRTIEECVMAWRKWNIAR